MIKNTVLSLFIFLTSWLFTVNAMANDSIRQDVLLKSTTSWDGDTVPETVGTVHRGYTGDEAAVFLVFYAGVRGQPLSQNVK
ncbi:hypothetical protein [Serratia proteamaculans]|uniref:hypothetical protein n=1 Tax=Serratia proteamaculans TaxID=28151 RepID=UPI001981C0BC|nr:hypothetical protein [Serratia proteamaculans]